MGYRIRRTLYPLPPWTSIKAQALIDCLVEILDTIKGVPTTISVDPLEPEADKELWKLYTDDAASKEGSGAGLILQSPNREENTYAPRFDSQVSKNEAKYEALLAGLRLAKEVGAKQLEDLSDSLLITNQINATYAANDSRMKKYLDAVRILTNTFKSFSIKQISQGKSARVDALNKLASTSYDHLTKKVLVEVLSEKALITKRLTKYLLLQNVPNPTSITYTMACSRMT